MFTPYHDDHYNDCYSDGIDSMNAEISDLKRTIALRDREIEEHKTMVFSLTKNNEYQLRRVNELMDEVGELQEELDHAELQVDILERAINENKSRPSNEFLVR